MELNHVEQQVYQRQMMMHGWGESGQKKLKSSTAFIAGAGGLGSPVAFYLAAAGVGTLKICDFDSVELSNLNRQILHGPARVGVEKAISANQTLQGVNHNIRIVPLVCEITQDSVAELVGDADIIIDCLDNFATRFILNSFAARKRAPYVHGSVWGMEGRLTFVHVPDTPCLRCVFAEAPPEELFPIVGATAGVVGTLQALEAVKWLTGVGKNLMNQLLVWNGQVGEFCTFKLDKDPNCPVCGVQSSPVQSSLVSSRPV